jgi:hypothetical protein
MVAIKASTASRDVKYIACPETTCSTRPDTRPASTSASTESWMTKARWTDKRLARSAVMVYSCDIRYVCVTWRTLSMLSIAPHRDSSPEEVLKKF